MTNTVVLLPWRRRTAFSAPLSDPHSSFSEGLPRDVRAIILSFLHFFFFSSSPQQGRFFAHFTRGLLTLFFAASFLAVFIWGLLLLLASFFRFEARCCPRGDWRTNAFPPFFPVMYSNDPQEKEQGKTSLKKASRTMALGERKKS